MGKMHTQPFKEVVIYSNQNKLYNRERKYPIPSLNNVIEKPRWWSKKPRHAQWVQMEKRCIITERKENKITSSWYITMHTQSSMSVARECHLDFSCQIRIRSWFLYWSEIGTCSFLILLCKGVSQTYSFTADGFAYPPLVEERGCELFGETWSLDLSQESITNKELTWILWIFQGKPLEQFD